MTLEEKLKEIEDRLNRLENRLKISLFEMEKISGQPKEEGMEERLLEMEDLILLLQIENTKLKEKLVQEIDIEFSPKVSQPVDERLSRIEEEIANMRAIKLGEHEEYAKPMMPERRREEPHYRRERPAEIPRRRVQNEEKKEDEVITVKGRSVLEDLQKILNK